MSTRRQWWDATIRSPAGGMSENEGDRDNDDEDFDDLGAGIDGYQPVDIQLVREVCPFIGDTLRTGGKDHREPVWFLSLGIACHTTDPVGTAHARSNGYHAHSETETDEKLAIARRDRKNNPKLGPPSCTTIKDAGVPQCVS